MLHAELHDACCSCKFLVVPQCRGLNEATDWWHQEHKSNLLAKVADRAVSQTILLYLFICSPYGGIIDDEGYVWGVGELMA